jgi:hypothetical protein
MKLLALVLLLSASLAIAGCRGGSSGAAATPQPETALGNLRPALDVTSANPCQNGDRKCLDIVLTEMRRRLVPLEKTCDHNALFATMYLRMTEQIRDAYDAGRLQNPAATSHLTAWFANYYFHAYDDWHAGRKDAVPQAWRIAFDAADNRQVRGLGDLLLGMNAHVSRDLPYVVSQVLPAPAAAIDPDYELVNTLIASLSADLLREVAQRFDPTVATAALPLTLGGAGTFGTFVALWRAQSWARGNELLAASADRQPAIAQGIEFDSATRALAILPQVSYLPLLENSAARDAYCADHR